MICFLGQHINLCKEIFCLLTFLYRGQSEAKDILTKIH